MSVPPLPHVLITGGSRGIGLAVAQLFAANFYRCTLISRNSEQLSSAVSSLESSHLPSSARHQYLAGDITKASFWAPDTFSASYDKQDGGKIDVLVNCAGITQNSLFVRTTAEDVQNIVDTNLTAMMLGTRYLLRKRYMRAADKEFSPAIINVASLLGIKGGKGAVAYAASKAGVLGMFRQFSE